VLGWILPFLLLAAAGPPLEIAVDPRPGVSFDLVLSGPAGGAGAGEFRGGVRLTGSQVEMPFSGRAELAGDRLRLAATVRYADVPADWLSHYRPETFDYRIRAEVAGAGTVSWEGELAWSDISFAGGRDALSRFVALGSLELTSLSSTRTEGRGVLSVTNPFAFPITIAAADYRLRVNGKEIGGGTAKGRLMKAGKKNAGLELPFRLEEKTFLAAAGPDWVAGASLDAGVSGSLTLRLPAGDLAVPFDFPRRIGTDGARSGVFAPAPGATSLSPR
jgi:hypothetical protein